MKISADVVIDKGADEVFDFVATNHHSNHPRWDPMVVSIEPIEAGAAGLGSGFRMTRRLMGREEQHVFRFTEWEAGRAMSYAEESGPMSFVARSRLEPMTEGRTRLVLDAEAHPKGLKALLAPALRPLFTRQINGNLATIKSLVEAGPGE